MAVMANTPGLDGALGAAAFWVAAFRIVVINVLLSGDNAVVIALACRNLPHRQRLWGMVFGAGVAVVLLMVFAGLVARLMELPYLKAAGGVALFYIAAKLLLPEDQDETEVQAEAHLWRAVRIVVVADIVMSLDNIIAVATAAQGNWTLLAIGLAVSIPIIIAGAALIMALLDRLPILVWFGAALLGWVAAEAIVTDKAVAPALAGAFGEGFAATLQWAACAAGAVLVLVAGGLWRRALAKKHATAGFQ
jgi:YjbE family integral membrane protein